MNIQIKHEQAVRNRYSDPKQFRAIFLAAKPGRMFAGREEIHVFAANSLAKV